MELTDLIPENPVFYLSSQNKEYELRIPNLEDRVEMIRLCGGTEASVMAVFNEKKWDQIIKVVYRLLKDKSDFVAKKDHIIDDEGIRKEVLITGPILLLRAILTQTEAIKMLGALTSAITSSEPLVKEFIHNEVKKNSLLHAGENSSTSSPANMDTLQNSLGNLPTGS